MTLRGRLLKTLTSDETKEKLLEIYDVFKDSFKGELQSFDRDTIIMYIKAYCIDIFDNIKDENFKLRYVMAMEIGLPLPNIFNEFVEKMNATAAKIAEPIHIEEKDEITYLIQYKNTKIYKELSKSDKEISSIIKECAGYYTINELRNHKYMINFRGYIFTQEELDIIEKTKKFPQLNQFAHTIYDEKVENHYECNHSINGEDDELKRFLVNTNKSNPKYEIIFEDGTIIEYYKGDIRVKPYTFKQILELTKLFCSAYYDEMKIFYENMFNIDDSKETSYQIGRQMIRNSFVNVRMMIDYLGEIYTKKMIDDSKKKLIKIKEIADEYDL